MPLCLHSNEKSLTSWKPLTYFLNFSQPKGTIYSKVKIFLYICIQLHCFCYCICSYLPVVPLNRWTKSKWSRHFSLSSMFEILTQTYDWKVKLCLLYCHPPQLRPAFETVWTVCNHYPNLHHVVAACLASCKLCLFSYSPRQASQRLSMARYATGTATEIRLQWDSNPVLTCTARQVAGMRFNRSSFIIYFLMAGCKLSNDAKLIRSSKLLHTDLQLLWLKYTNLQAMK